MFDDHDSDHVLQVLCSPDGESPGLWTHEVGDALAVPRGRKLTIGTDLDRDVVLRARRRAFSRMLEVERGDDGVYASPVVGSSLILWQGDETDDDEYTTTRKRARVREGQIFGPLRDVRFRLVRRDVAPLSARLRRIRGALVDDPPAALLFARRAILDDPGRTAVTVLCALGRHVADARGLAVARPTSSLRVLARDALEGALLLAIEDVEGVSVHELSAAARAAGTPLDDALGAFIAEALSAHARQARLGDLLGARVRLADGAPVPSPWARGGGKAMDAAAVREQMARWQIGGPRLPDTLEEAGEDAASARRRLHALVRALFPARCAAHAAFLEEARVLPAAAVPSWVVPEEVGDREHDDPDAPE